MRKDAEAYIIGYFIGDGSASTGGDPPTLLITLCGNQDDEVSVGEAVTKMGQEVNFKYYREKSWHLHVTRWMKIILKKEGFNLPSTSRTKRIPEKVLAWPEERRWELLAGLMDADGSVGVYDDGARWKEVRASYDTASEGLADDMVTLATGLGLRVTKHVYERTGRDLKIWRILFRRETLERLRDNVILQEKKKVKLDSELGPGSKLARLRYKENEEPSALDVFKT